MSEIFFSGKYKSFRSEDVNYTFDMEDGTMATWGRDQKDDPQQAPAPFIADIEIGTTCNGLGKPCKFCYKSNTRVGENMSLETFKKVFAKLPPHLTQIAFGIGDLDGNPEMFQIFEHCRHNKIVPNVTTNGWKMTFQQAQQLRNLCGAVAVSKYEPKDVCYDAVAMLTDVGLKQTNIHQLVSRETMPSCLETIADMKSDIRLAELNAVVFLTLKPKGIRNDLTMVGDDEYKVLIQSCLDSGVRFGFDSCSANRFMRVVAGHPMEERFKLVSEPCESTLFSTYINVEGQMFPCSFAEGTPGWEEGIDVAGCGDFQAEVWNHPRVLEFRSKLLGRCRNCPIYDL